MIHSLKDDMMQLLLILMAASLLGFTYGYYTDGFLFSANICLFAGLTLIMPSLFQIKLTDVKLIWVYKSTILKGMIVNYILLPLVAVVIGFATQDYGIAAGLFLLSVLSGGGMVMYWIKQAQGDTSLGFLLLFINLLFISLSLLMLHLFATYSAPYFNETYVSDISITRFTTEVITLLILIPFVASRVIRFIPPLLKGIQNYSRVISQLSIFIILFYLFGLQDSQQLIDIYDFEPELFPIAFVATLGFYMVITLLSFWVYDLQNRQERAAFWHTTTRYVTLALVMTTFSSQTFGTSMLIPVMSAYIIQIGFAVLISKRFQG
jgi:hypothetical protein